MNAAILIALFGIGVILTAVALGIYDLQRQFKEFAERHDDAERRRQLRDAMQKNLRSRPRP